MMTVNAAIPAGKKTGLIPRDYKTHPSGCYAWAPSFPANQLIDESEWGDRLNEQQKLKSSLLDLRTANYDNLKSLDQNGYGLCWAFSSTKATMYTRALDGEPVFPLSAWYVAGNINHWRDQGGWGASSLEFIAQNGVPAMSYCPSYHSSSVQTGAVENALLHKVMKWWDGGDDPNENQKILISMLLTNRACVVDLNDMGHSMCAIAIASLNPVTIIYDNSWGTAGDPQGLYRGTGARARPDGLVIPITSVISTN